MALTTINGGLSSLNSSISVDVPKYEKILASQTAMQGIVNAENNRLLTKKSSIEDALQSQQRMIALNQNYSSRYNQYVIMVITVVIALVLFLGITMIQRNMENPPTGLFTFLTIIILGSAAIYILMVYYNMTGRSNMNFDEINISAPVALSPAHVQAKLDAATAAGNLQGGAVASDACVGAACCAGTSHWDVSGQFCTSPFTTMDQAYSQNQAYGQRDINKQVNSFSDSEYSSYGQYP
jgi:hypothetical protein